MQGDALTMLRTLPDASVHCCVTRPSGANGIELVSLFAKGFHCGRGSRSTGCRPNVTSTFGYPLFLAGVLNFSQGETIKGLSFFDSQERQYCEKKPCCLHVGHLPAVQIATAFGAGLTNETIASKKAMQEVYSFWGDLLYADTFTVCRLSRVASNTHRVGISLDADSTVGIDHSGAIGQINVFHITDSTQRGRSYQCHGRSFAGTRLASLRRCGRVRCTVVSPARPIDWGLRDYGMAGQIGLEPTPDEYVARMVEVFREVRRVLRDDGTLWLNLGDSYNAYNGNAGPGSGFSRGAACDTERPHLESGHGLRTKGLKPKDLVGIPWRVAFALQSDGWWLRSDIIWAKPNPMPESVTDRPTKAHEYLFLFAKSERYYYDADAIAEPLTTDSRENYPARARIVGRGQQAFNSENGRTGDRDKSGGFPPKRSGNKERRCADGADGQRQAEHLESGVPWVDDGFGRNRRSVWTITTKPFRDAHFAVMPEALVEPCILAGSPRGGAVLDPFAGSGTVGVVALRHGRSFVGIELNQKYVAMAERRIWEDAPLLNRVEVGAIG